MKKYYITGLLLFVSLAVNVFLGSIVIGKQVPTQHRFRAAMERINALPEPQRTEARVIVKKYGPEIKQQVKTLRTARQENFAYLQQPQFDKAKAEENFKRIREQTTVVQALIQKLSLEITEKLTPEQRAQILRPGRAGERDDDNEAD